MIQAILSSWKKGIALLIALHVKLLPIASVGWLTISEGCSNPFAWVPKDGRNKTQERRKEHKV